MPRLRSFSVALLSLCGLLFLFGRLLEVSSPQPAAAAPVSAKEKQETAATVAECRWAATPIVLDGKADEAAWKQAQVTESFGRTWLKEPGGNLRGKTRATLLWDRDYLYFHADMDAPDTRVGEGECIPPLIGASSDELNKGSCLPPPPPAGSPLIVEVDS